MGSPIESKRVPEIAPLGAVLCALAATAARLRTSANQSDFFIASLILHQSEAALREAAGTRTKNSTGRSGMWWNRRCVIYCREPQSKERQFLSGDVTGRRFMEQITFG